VVTTLSLCNACERHFRMHEPSCPFCGAPVSEASRTAPRLALGPGASRSRRYAASAAFVAGGAVAACGGATSDTGTEKSGHGGASFDAGLGEGGMTGNGGKAIGTGGRGPGGALGNGGRLATGGLSAGGAALGGTSAGGGITFGGATSGGAGGVGQARHPCMGATDPATPMLCRTQMDCNLRSQCVLSPPDAGCRFVPQQCTFDVDCAGGTVCQLGYCNAHVCSTSCSTSSCPPDTRCAGDHCVPIECGSVDYACPTGYACRPSDSAADGHGCVQVHCTTNADCQAGYDCVASSPASGCVHRTCAADGDCDCGYCVNGACEGHLGYCYEMIAMPYGCVWPDEELV
jgi:hypothetical protein